MGIYLWLSTYMKDEREIPAIVNEKNCDLVLKFSHFGWGYLTCNGSGEHKGIYLWPSTYMQDMREISATVSEKIVIKC